MLCFAKLWLTYYVNRDQDDLMASLILIKLRISDSPYHLVIRLSGLLPLQTYDSYLHKTN